MFRSGFRTSIMSVLVWSCVNAVGFAQYAPTGGSGYSTSGSGSGWSGNTNTGSTSGGFGSSGGGSTTTGGGSTTGGGGSGNSCQSVEMDFEKIAKGFGQCCCQFVGASVRCSLVGNSTDFRALTVDGSFDGSSALYLKRDQSLLTFGNEFEAELKVTVSGNVSIPVQITKEAEIKASRCMSGDQFYDSGLVKVQLDGNVTEVKLKIEGMTRGQYGFSPVLAAGIRANGSGEISVSCRVLQGSAFELDFGPAIGQLNNYGALRERVKKLNTDLLLAAQEHVSGCLADTLERAIVGVKQVYNQVAKVNDARVQKGRYPVATGVNWNIRSPGR